MSGWLYRAILELPRELCTGRDWDSSRVVFFETPKRLESPGTYLQGLLATLWCVEPQTLDDCIYNVNDEYEVLRQAYADGTGDLRLLETGCGGDVTPAVGPDRLHYAAPSELVLLVGPRNAARIHTTLTKIECMRLAQEAGDDPKAPAAVACAYKAPALLAEVRTKLNGDGPILEAEIRRPGAVHAEKVLIDAARVSAPAVRALRACGAKTVRRAKRPATEGGAA